MDERRKNAVQMPATLRMCLSMRVKEDKMITAYPQSQSKCAHWGEVYTTWEKEYSIQA